MSPTPVRGLLRRLLGRAGDRQRGFAEAGVAVTGAALVLGAALGSGVASTVVTMSDGVTWLPDAETGQVVQINPGTGRAERRLQVAEPGSDLRISQRDGHLVIMDGRTGTLRSIDLATLLSGGERRPAGPAEVLVGGGQVYLVSLDAGLVSAVDALTLRDLGRPFDAGVALADAVVDDQGAVWAVTTTGDLRRMTWRPGAGRFDVGAVRRVDGGGAGTRLLPHARGVTVLAPDGGALLQVGTGKDLAVAVPGLTGEVLPAATAPADLAPAGVPARSAVVMLSGRQVLDVAVGALGCARPGRPAVFAGLVYVPCTGAGRVVVLRADGSRARADVVLPAGRDPQLLVDDGRLVVHTEDGSRAVVIEADGRTRVIDTGRSQAPVHDPRDGRSASVSAQPPQVSPGAPGVGAPGGALGAGGVPVVDPDAVGGASVVGDTPLSGASPTGGPAPTTGSPRPGATPGATPDATARAVPAPSGVVATPGEPDADGLTDVVVTWRASSTRPDSYVVRSSAPGVAAVEVDGRTTTATVRGVVCGTRATFSVEAVEGAATSPPASSRVVRTEGCPAPPAVPSDVTAVVADDGTVTVTWVPAGDPVDSYLVGPAGGSATAAGASATSVVLRDVPPGASVRFAVRAVRAGLTSTAALSPAVVVPGVPGGAGPVTVELERRLPGELGFVVRWTPPAANGSFLTRYVVTWSGKGFSGSVTPGAVSGCSAGQGCGAGAAQRSEVTVETLCSGGAACVEDDYVTVTVTAENGVGAGPVATTEFFLPPFVSIVEAVEAVEPVAPAVDDPDVRMVVRLDPPAVFRDHPGACELAIDHSDGTRSTAGWSCRAEDVVIGPFPPGNIGVTAVAVVPGGPNIDSRRYRAEVPPRSAWEYCDASTGVCTPPVSLDGDPPVTVRTVPWAPRLPAGDERPPLAATGAALLLAAGALRALRRRRADGVTSALPTPHVTTEETPA